jgi:hypothetical protein
MTQYTNCKTPTTTRKLIKASMSFVLCGVVSRYFCHIPSAISWGDWWELAFMDALEGMEGTEPAAVVEDWVVEVEEGVGSRAERFGAIAAGIL